MEELIDTFKIDDEDKKKLKILVKVIQKYKLKDMKKRKIPKDTHIAFQLIYLVSKFYIYNYNVMNEMDIKKIECAEEYVKEQNKEELKKYQKDYYQRNKPRIQEYLKKYSERKKQYNKQYQEKNKDQLMEYYKDYYERNKDKLKEKAKIKRQKKNVLNELMKLYKYNIWMKSLSS